MGNIICIHCTFSSKEAQANSNLIPTSAYDNSSAVQLDRAQPRSSRRVAGDPFGSTR
ncbi:MAG: hypothetical protein NZ769_10420 [Anaerolineae bacterium]|nr:hypothetical protein [Anaerolineae bacterium]